MPKKQKATKKSDQLVTIIVKNNKGKPVNLYLSIPETVSLMNQLHKMLAVKKEVVDIVTPPKDIFQHERNTLLSHMVKNAPQPVPILKETVFPEDGGILNYMEDFLYPVKGWVTPEAAQANNTFKRFFIGQIRLLSRNPFMLVSLVFKKIRDRYIFELVSLGEITLNRFFLKDTLYQPSCQSLRKLVSTFMIELGVHEGVANSFARTFATMFEYDNAYLLILQDLLSETTVEELSNEPIRTFRKLVKILRERDRREAMHERFESMLFILKLVLKIPKVKRSYQKALASIDFTKLQLDEIDKYQCLRWSTYDFMGRSFQDRTGEFMMLHKGIPPRVNVFQS